VSGGHWGYASQKIEELAGDEGDYQAARTLLMAAARTEHLIDWAESCDTSRADAERQVYDLWVETFDKLYP
jgi:hypothetical protein